VPICSGVTLPGNEIPEAYLDMMGVPEVKRAMVVCPGNGGLVAALLARGAEEVVALEFRSRFHDALEAVLILVSKGLRAEEKEGRYKIVRTIPEEENDLGQFDLIIWTEGVEEITRPKATFRALSKLVGPGGKMIVEVYHGKHEWVDRINSWKPSGDAFLKMGMECFGKCWTDKRPSRREGGRIYVLEMENAKALKEAIAKDEREEKKKTAAKKRPTPVKKEEKKTEEPAPVKKKEEKAPEKKPAPKPKSEKKEAPPPPPPPPAEKPTPAKKPAAKTEKKVEKKD
jgi:hypothetical protein